MNEFYFLPNFLNLDLKHEKVYKKKKILKTVNLVTGGIGGGQF